MSAAIDQEFKQIFEAKPSKRISNLLMTYSKESSCPKNLNDHIIVLQENAYWPSSSDIDSGKTKLLVIKNHKLFILSKIFTWIRISNKNLGKKR